LLLAVLFFVLDPATESWFPRCPFFVLTGYYCPGCGSQRAIHSFLHFDWMGVVRNNVLFYPALAVVVYHYARPVLNRKLAWRLPDFFRKKSTPWILLAVILLFWILRNLPVYPFWLLAPG